jgi:hypothetical protein
VSSVQPNSRLHILANPDGCTRLCRLDRPLGPAIHCSWHLGTFLEALVKRPGISSGLRDRIDHSIVRSTLGPQWYLVDSFNQPQHNQGISRSNRIPWNIRVEEESGRVVGELSHDFHFTQRRSTSNVAIHFKTQRRTVVGILTGFNRRALQSFAIDRQNDKEHMIIMVHRRLKDMK